MKKIMSMLVLGSAALVANLAHSHGTPTANHGGIVQAVGETWIELVVKGDLMEVYLEDDGDEVPSTGISGKLTVVNGAGKTDFTLKPAGANKLETKGKGAVKGTKVLAMILLADKKTKVVTTFEIK